MKISANIIPDFDRDLLGYLMCPQDNLRLFNRLLLVLLLDLLLAAAAAAAAAVPRERECKVGIKGPGGHRDWLRQAAAVLMAKGDPSYRSRLG